MIGQLQKILDEYVRSGEECGCQLVIYRNGKFLCSLCSGFTDHTRKRKVDENTLFPVFSAGKSVLTTLLHICVEHGMLSYDSRVSDFWREYGCSGKESTLVWHFLTHRAGMSEFPAELEYPDYFNWEKACAALEKASPCGKIGGFHEYHAFTYGVLVGHLLEKASGMPLRKLLDQYILSPLQTGNFQWGSPGRKTENIARIEPWIREDGSAVPNDWLSINDPAYLFEGLNPSVNTLCNARALAEIHAALLPAGFHGKRLLRESTLEEALKIRRAPEFPVEKDQWDKFGLGYVLCGPEAPWNRMFGQAGACGAEGFADRETGYAIGLTRNQLNLTDPVYPLRDAVSRVLGIPERVW